MADTPGIGSSRPTTAPSAPRPAQTGDRRTQGGELPRESSGRVAELPKQKHIVDFEGRKFDMGAPRGTYLDISV